jgi:Tol biopolymer transport system component
MIPRLIIACLGVLSFSTSAISQQVVFSRRVYVVRGHSFQQLWMWSPETGTLTQLTQTTRDHERPVCAPDGMQIFFESRSTRPLAPLNRWRFDMTSGAEAPLANEPATLPTENQPSFARLAGCDERTLARSPDGVRLACTATGEEIVIYDVGRETETKRIPFHQRMSDGEPYPPWPLEAIWSPDGQHLLIGTYGEESTSTSYRLDYFVLDLTTEQWTRAFTGNGAVWLPDNTRIVFSTPRDLAALPWSPRRSVWVAHLGIFDLTSHSETALTSGITNDVQPTLCALLNKPAPFLHPRQP